MTGWKTRQLYSFDTEDEEKHPGHLLYILPLSIESINCGETWLVKHD